MPAAGISEELDGWVHGEGEKTLGTLISVFGKRAFAIVFVMLLGVSALPLPTGGATHVFEVIAMLLSLELIAGREEIWLPQRWRATKLPTTGRFIVTLLRVTRRLERLSRRRLAFLFGHRLSNLVFGALALAGALTAFLAPPFTGLDTLPSLGVVLVSMGVLFEDFLYVVVGIVVGAAGAFAVILLGGAALKGLQSLT